MIPYLIIIFFVLLYTVAIRLMILEHKRTAPDRYFCKMREHWPYKIAVEQVIDDLGKTYNPLQSTLERITPRYAGTPSRISSKTL